MLAWRIARLQNNSLRWKFLALLLVVLAAAGDESVLPFTGCCVLNTNRDRTYVKIQIATLPTGRQSKMIAKLASEMGAVGESTLFSDFPYLAR